MKNRLKTLAQWLSKVTSSDFDWHNGQLENIIAQSQAETCNKIGILKNGKLLKEMDSQNVSSQELEDIYIKFMKD